VIGTGLDVLVGPSGQTLEALQELTRLAVHQRTGARRRLVLDVGGYRAKRRAELAELARRVAEQARDSGEHVRLAPMSPFERKAIHDEIAALDGVMSESEGEEPQRCVIVKPAPGRTGTLPADIA
jgi:spoIIIJ-associated protein